MKQQYDPEVLGWNLAELGMAVRTTNKLEERGIFIVRDLLHCCSGNSVSCPRNKPGKPCRNTHLMDIPNFGEKSLDEVFAALEKVGFKREKK